MAPKRVMSLWLFVHVSQALTSFRPECPLPSPGTEFVSGPNVRSTLSIVWNCLSVIFLCTWNIQHLNVPALRRRPNGFLQKMWWRILDSRTKLKWMIFTVLAPEYLVGKALGERLAVRGTDWFLNGNALDNAPFESIHGYLCNMGYFILDVDDSMFPATNQVQEQEPNKDTITSSALPPQTTPGEPEKSPPGEQYKENVVSKSDEINLGRLNGRYLALNLNQWHCASKMGMGRVPFIPSQQLEKLDRGGALVKGLAIVQVAYLIVQLVARWAFGLPSTQLEIATLAFSVSSAITYVLYWDRPQGVDTIHIVQANPRRHNDPSVGVVPSDLLNVWHRPDWSFEKCRACLAKFGPSYLWHGPRSYFHEPDVGPIPIPNDASNPGGTDYMRLIRNSIHGFFADNEDTLPIVFGAIFGGALFGALHCLAWNFEFPTRGERLAWRVCSVLTTVLPIVAAFPMVMWIRLNPFGVDPKKGIIRTAVSLVLVFGIFLPYVLARLFIMVEIIRSLAFLPPGAFADTCSGSFPHWG
ncbi:hypothetical protein B0T26DRAFT_714882 [Lasiosphaeria miniovina]|uniref:Uncharacterized protein n=1 Tax=Lasiosphaeria miniovina TaxID=1954250 RepID=A0AA40DQR7_9PEZI|nr:uncharacterized protein B0T26DRAFT_714882 [Lasiosphaeria miniovina]KAK0712654.1 hypothetical protein B0T26DRAFT_714882 [Lasiosphaeria miniovina]